MITKCFNWVRLHGPICSFAPGPQKLLGGHGVGDSNCMALKLEVGNRKMDTIGWPDRTNLHRKSETGTV